MVFSLVLLSCSLLNPPKITPASDHTAAGGTNRVLSMVFPLPKGKLQRNKVEPELAIHVFLPLVFVLHKRFL